MTVRAVSGEILRRHTFWVLAEAGLDPDQQLEVSTHEDACDGAFRAFAFGLSEREPALLAEVALAPGRAAATVRLAVRTDSAALLQRAREVLEEHAASADGTTYRARARHEAERRWAAAVLPRALAAAGLPPIPEDRRAARLDEATARVLVEVHERHTAFATRTGVLRAMQAPRTPPRLRSRLAEWILERLPRFESRRHRGQMWCALLDLAGPAQAATLMRLVRDAPLSDRDRGGLLVVLGRTRAAEAGPFLAAELAGPLRSSALAGLETLGRGAAAHADAVRPLLRDLDPDVRRSARRILRRMGVEVPEPPRAAAAPPRAPARPLLRVLSGGPPPA